MIGAIRLSFGGLSAVDANHVLDDTHRFLRSPGLIRQLVDDLCAARDRIDRQDSQVLRSSVQPGLGFVRLPGDVCRHIVTLCP